MEILELFPIGHVIETVDASFDPNVSIGGTWELNHDSGSNGNAYIMVSKDEADTDFNSVGKTGGAETVSISNENYPAHTHNCRGGFMLAGNRSAGSTWGSLTVNGSWSLWSGYVYNSSMEPDGYGQGTITFPKQANASGTAHNNMCAYKIVNRWIRVS